LHGNCNVLSDGRQTAHRHDFPSLEFPLEQLAFDGNRSPPVSCGRDSDPLSQFIYQFDILLKRDCLGSYVHRMGAPGCRLAAVQAGLQWSEKMGAGSSTKSNIAPGKDHRISRSRFISIGNIPPPQHPVSPGATGDHGQHAGESSGRRISLQLLSKPTTILRPWIH